MSLPDIRAAQSAVFCATSESQLLWLKVIITMVKPYASYNFKYNSEKIALVTMRCNVSFDLYLKIDMNFIVPSSELL